jgi:hypothetical protein
MLFGLPVSVKESGMQVLYLEGGKMSSGWRPSERNRREAALYNGLLKAIAKKMTEDRDASAELIGRAAANIAVSMGLGHTNMAREDRAIAYAAGCLKKARILVYEDKPLKHNLEWKRPWDEESVAQREEIKVVQADVFEEFEQLVENVIALESGMNVPEGQTIMPGVLE